MIVRVVKATLCDAVYQPQPLLPSRNIGKIEYNKKYFFPYQKPPLYLGGGLLISVGVCIEKNYFLPADEAGFFFLVFFGGLDPFSAFDL